MLCCLAVGLASARHTGSLAFPIDDAYIYSNYVLAAAKGHPFSYNPGETSGGITSLGWYLLCTLSYWILAPFQAWLGGLAAPVVREQPELAMQAGHLYLAAYLPGALCLAATGVGVYRLARLALPGAGAGSDARVFACLLIGVVAAADLGLVWGAMSGLEVALSSALAVWAIVLLLSDLEAGRLRWSLVLAAALPLARPDLLAISLAAALWLLFRALSKQGADKSYADVVLYLAAMGAGLAVMSAAYLIGWGRPLPSSFYAKVGGLRLGSRFFSAAQELLIAGRSLPFVAALATILSAGLLMSSKSKVQSPKSKARFGDFRLWTLDSATLLIMVSVAYVAALMLTLPWFGQEDRYLLPVHPFAIVLAGGGVWALISPKSKVQSPKSPNRTLDFGLWTLGSVKLWLSAAVIVVALAGANYLWATRNHVVEVRNISDAHIQPALWLAANTPVDTVVAAEPVGAVRLFSGRRTIDLVGLTTPATLGTYRIWPRAWRALREAGASYLLFYPRWFDGPPPPWVVEVQRFPIPDNKIAGDDVIAVYSLDWARLDDQSSMDAYNGH
jgi:hypothetical protein